MARSSETFNKRDNEKKKQQKRQEKEQRREERKAENKGKSFEDMLAYVDENGNITSTPPDPNRKKTVVKESDIDLTSKNKGGSTPAYKRTGTVKFFDSSRGFGFIKDDQSGEEFFFHQSSVDFPVDKNNRVNFETSMGPKGPTATEIKLAS